MLTRRAWLGSIAPALALIRHGTARAQVTDLVATLGTRLGVSPEQAAGGAGAILALARQRLAPAEFSIVADSAPGLDRLLGAAPAVADTGGGIEDLVAPFALLGIAPQLIPPFVDSVLQFVADAGSDPAAGLLRRTLLAP